MYWNVSRYLLDLKFCVIWITYMFVIVTGNNIYGVLSIPAFFTFMVLHRRVCFWFLSLMLALISLGSTPKKFLLFMVMNCKMFSAVTGWSILLLSTAPYGMEYPFRKIRSAELKSVMVVSQDRSGVLFYWVIGCQNQLRLGHYGTCPGSSETSSLVLRGSCKIL